MPQELHGKAKWLKLKRELTEDAKKIWIVAPIPRQYNKKVKTIEDGEEVEKTETIKYNAYRYVLPRQDKEDSRLREGDGGESRLRHSSARGKAPRLLRFVYRRALERERGQHI